MLGIYAPFLTMIALYESKYPSHLFLGLTVRFQARAINQNRLTGLADDEHSLGWDNSGIQFSPDADGWGEKVRVTIPRIEQDEIWFLKRLQREMAGRFDGQGSESGGAGSKVTGSGIH
jgi:hypothetical protein